MKLQPLRDCVLIRRDAADKMSKGGIFLPDAAQTKQTRGTVMAIGPGKRLDNGELVPMAVKPGDRVIFSYYVGDEIEVEGEKLCIMREDGIHSVIVGE
jgi:chaperonin GroES